MNIYNEQTMKKINLLAKNDVEIAHDEQHHILIKTAEEEWMNLRSNERAQKILLEAQQSEEKKKEFAERLGITPQELSMYMTTRSNFRPPKRDIILIATLSRKTMPSVRDFNHILMELKQPGLFTYTYDKMENRRNQLLILLIQYMEQNPVDVSERVAFVSGVFRYLGADALDKNKAKEPEELEMIVGTKRLQDWKDILMQVGECDFSTKRRQYRARFAARNTIDGSAQSCIHDRILKNLERIRGQEYALYTLERVQEFFGKPTNPKSRVPRMIIIDMGIGMECTLDEINNMLAEANRGLLYPGTWDEDEVQAIQKIQTYAPIGRN